jgi:hypothetical protein
LWGGDNNAKQDVSCLDDGGAIPTLHTPQRFAYALLNAIAAPTTQNNVWFVIGWERSEGGDDWGDGQSDPSEYNPLNCSQTERGSTGVNTNNGSPIQSYVDWKEGLSATSGTIMGSLHGDISLLTAFRDNAGETSPAKLYDDLANAGWSSGNFVAEGYDNGVYNYHEHSWDTVSNAP